MNQVWDIGIVPGSPAVIHPLLMECDRQGQVVWLSAGARLMFGDAENLVDAVRVGGPGRSGRPKPDSGVRLSCLLERGNRVLLSLQFGDVAEVSARQEATGLLNLQDNFMHHCFRLERAERHLSTRARRGKRSGGGRQAMIQIERERQRLGRELHTGVGQMLAAIRMQLEIVTPHLPAPAGPVQQALTNISTLASDALDQVRSVSRRLHPPEWQRLSLESALRQLWAISGIAQFYESTLDIKPLPQEPDLETKVLMYRAVQEALSNLTRHSKATRVGMVLEARDGRLILRVQDNGVGFDAARVLGASPSVASGIGLRSIREQAAALGGAVTIESGPGGTRLDIWAPFAGIKKQLPT